MTCASLGYAAKLWPRWHVFFASSAGDDAPRAVLYFLVLILAGMDRKGTYVVCVCEGRHHPFRGAKADSHDQAVQQTIEISQLQFAARWLMSLLGVSCRFSGAGCEETVVLPQLQLLESLWSRVSSWTR